MRFFILMSILLISSLAFSSIPAVSFDKTGHLFFVERSKNRNLVQYDVRLTENDDILDSNPVAVYWILENGRQRDLNLIQKRYAYGIESYEKLERNKFRVVLVAIKDRKIIVEKAESSFRAIIPINGTPSILERVYVESRERLIGLPRVLYIDLFGRVKETGRPLNERIISQ